MTLLDLLESAAGMPVAVIRAILDAAAKAAPDLRDDIAALVAALESAVTPEALTVVGATVLDEARKILQGQTDGRRHPSDGA